MPQYLSLFSYIAHKIDTPVNALAVNFSSRKVPAEWKEGIIVSLYKGKGSRSCCNSYRPISLLSVPGKVRIISSRVTGTLTATAR